MLSQSTGGQALRLHSCRALSSQPQPYFTSEKIVIQTSPVDKPHTRLLVVGQSGSVGPPDSDLRSLRSLLLKLWSLLFGVSLELGTWCLGFSWDLDFGVWDFDLCSPFPIVFTPHRS